VRNRRPTAMKYLSRVVWSEGMHLGPHHFQVQSRYFEDSIRYATASLFFESYGLVGYAMDAEALRNGTVSVVHARGMFSDGLTFHMPECDRLPQTRRIADLFPPDRDSVVVALSVPSRKQNGLNCVPAESERDVEARFVAEAQLLHDETTGIDEKPVRLGRKNIQLRLDTETSDGQMQLPIARVVRDYSGHFIYDPSFIPPCVQLSASDRIMLILQRLIEILEDKSATLARGNRGAARSLAEFSTRDIANFWFLHSVNSALVPLRHLFVTKRGHPVELYTEMARLGGALCTFALDSHPRDMPVYDHQNLDKTFDALDKHIRGHLETIVPTNCIVVPLAKTSDYFYEGEVSDQRCFGAARWVLGVRSPVGEVELIVRTPQLIKVCSKLFVPELVKRALPGMALAHLPVPPSAISARLDAQYFGINKSGPCWDHLTQTREVGVYVPGEIPDPDIELLVILES
jgi:type VI secretion system protein ImpJ